MSDGRVHDFMLSGGDDAIRRFFHAVERLTQEPDEPFKNTSLIIAGHTLKLRLSDLSRHRITVAVPRIPVVRAIAVAAGCELAECGFPELLRAARIEIVNNLHQWRQNGLITDAMRAEMGPPLDCLTALIVSAESREEGQ